MAGLFKSGDMVKFILTFAATGDGRTPTITSTTVPQTGHVMAEETPGMYRVTTDYGIAILVGEGQLAATGQSP